MKSIASKNLPSDPDCSKYNEQHYRFQSIGRGLRYHGRVTFCDNPLQVPMQESIC
jgi:hypothetical protein